jgi:hypothetical protein
VSHARQSRALVHPRACVYRRQHLAQSLGVASFIITRRHPSSPGRATRSLVKRARPTIVDTAASTRSHDANRKCPAAAVSGPSAARMARILTGRQRSRLPSSPPSSKFCSFTPGPRVKSSCSRRLDTLKTLDQYTTREDTCRSLHLARHFPQSRSCLRPTRTLSVGPTTGIGHLGWRDSRILSNHFQM